jgi:hypothetical protein
LTVDGFVDLSEHLGCFGAEILYEGWLAFGYVVAEVLCDDWIVFGDELVEVSDGCLKAFDFVVFWKEYFSIFVEYYWKV